MESRPLGRSALCITPVTLGAWAIGGWFWGGQDEAESTRTIRASVDAGVTSIDTAGGNGNISPHFKVGVFRCWALQPPTTPSAPSLMRAPQSPP